MSTKQVTVTEPARDVAQPAFPMVGENIICFAKDWNEDPTSNNHVIVELAKANRVLWLNSIAMRKPDLGSKRDVLKIFRKLREFFRGPREARPNLFVYTPIALPFPHSRIAAVLNRGILKATVSLLRRRLGMKKFQLWTFLPNVVDYVGKLGESLVVYYCVDEWSEFSYIDGKKMADAEERLCRRADAVFATAHSLVEKRKQWNPETHLALHGVDYDLFSTALSRELPVASELAEIPQPVLGFYGLIHDWIDLDLIAQLADRHPEWSLVIIGEARVDVSKLAGRRNVHLLGRKPYKELPKFCKGFAVALLPFRMNGLAAHINPIKLREYLCAGLPVVSTDLPEVRHYSDHCVVATSYDEVERGIEELLKSDTAEARKQRSEAMKNETWTLRVADVARNVQRVKEGKCRNR